MVILSLLTAFITLCFLSTWIFFYHSSCLSLLVPVVFALVIGSGGYTAAMHRRRYWRNFYLKPDSRYFKLFTGKVLSIFSASLMAILYSLSFCAFIALGAMAEYLAVGIVWLTTLLYFPIAAKFTEQHTAPDISGYAVKRMLSLVSFSVAAIGYTVLLLLKDVPAYIRPESLNETMNAASAMVGAECHYINVALKSVQELTAAQWYFMIQSSQFIESPWLKFGGWTIFIFFSSFALMGMCRFIAELTEGCKSTLQGWRL